MLSRQKFTEFEVNHCRAELLSGWETIDEFTLLIASWVIRATWREIQRFVWQFKVKYTVHVST